ncbi:MAG: hypothetical protein KQA41_00410 [Candidatus Aenigmarchaeota archaeon]|nr:hypothetical protein [Candidatus Aenigmarchaeota archaeon]
MSMELEYPFKIMLYLVVVLVLIGIMMAFKDKILKICFFPPCEQKTKCDFETQNVQEIDANENIIAKYCFLCYEKSKECEKDKICYIVSFENNFDFSNDYIDIGEEKCEITCLKNTNMLYFSYSYFEDKIKVGC